MAVLATQGQAASIQVQFRTTAPGSIVSDLMKVANDLVPGSRPNPRPVKDSSGRPVIADFSFLGAISQANLDVVKVAYSNNLNVSKVVAFPQFGLVHTFDALTPNATVWSFSGSGHTFSISGNGGIWQAALAAESKGGTGSALRITDTALSSDYLSGVFDCGTNGLSVVRAVKISMYFKLSDTVNGVAAATASGYEANAANISISAGPAPAKIVAKNGNWWIIPNPNELASPAQPAAVDTGIAQTSFLYVEYISGPLDISIKYGTGPGSVSTMSGLSTYPHVSSGAGASGALYFSTEHAPSGSPTVPQKAIVIDDFSLEIIDADILT
jgi:hypothetical protein